MLEFRQEGRPEERTNGLDAEDYSNPSSRILEGCVCGVDTVPAEAVDGDGTVRIGPHIHEGSPAEELHEADGPESRWSFFKKLDEAFFLLLVFLFLLVKAMESGVFLGVEFLNRCKGIERA